MAICWNNTFVDHILIRIERGLLSIHRWQVRPTLPRTLAAAIANVKRDDLPRYSVEGQLKPLPVRLVLDKAVHLIRFHLDASQHHLVRTQRWLYMQMLWSGLKAGDREVHEPPNADPNGTAHPMQGDFLPQ